MKNITQKYNSLKLSPGGFTLIETFVAITILMIVVLGPMSLLSSALKNARYIGDEITANYLAQEGVELMIHQKNQQLGEEGVILDPIPYSCPLKFNGTDGYGCEIDGVDTIFNREIGAIQKQPGEFEITSTVTGNNIKSVTSSSIIFTN